METYKKFFKGIYEGTKKKNLRINRYTEEEVLKGIMEYIPKNDEGVLEIHEINFKTKERKVIKKVLIVNELSLTETEAISIKI